MTGYRLRNTDPYKNIKEKEVMIYETEVPNMEGRLAIVLVEKWGLVAGDTGNEDSTGRAKVDLMPPAELAIRACDIAESIYKELRSRNMIVSIPDLNEINKDIYL